MEFLRTPDEQFENLPDFDFAPNYIDIPSAENARMHYVDTQDGDELILMLHGEPSWSFLYRHMIHALKGDYRCIAPDLLGFGRSDKPTTIEDHTFEFHYQALVDFVEALDLTDITLIVQDWGGLLGLPFATEHDVRIKRLVILNTGLTTGEIPMGEGFMRWQQFAAKVGMRMVPGQLIQQSTVSDLSEEVVAAYNAPFPDKSYRAGVAAMPLLVPSEPDMAGAARHRAAHDMLANYEKPVTVLFSDKDPMLGGAVKYFKKLIPQTKDDPTIEDGGHFLQEDKGDVIAGHVRVFIERTA
ncbi:MAG: haloalkane dehalogenase [Chloroflexota bacterium]